ncbi:MAG: hypothetical protein ACYSWY_09520 [Planctomycetota bacterium]|jgi:hypothetical protein
MRILREFVLAALVLSLIVAVPIVDADEIAGCQGLIKNLKTSLDDVKIGGDNAAQTRASLELNLQRALNRFDQDKFCNSISLLKYFKRKVIALGKPDSDGDTNVELREATNLANLTEDVLDCVRQHCAAQYPLR